METLRKSNTKTLKQKSKDKWKNGNQKTHRNDCEQSRDGCEKKRRRQDYESSLCSVFLNGKELMVRKHSLVALLRRRERTIPRVYIQTTIRDNTFVQAPTVMTTIFKMIAAVFIAHRALDITIGYPHNFQLMPHYMRSRCSRSKLSQRK